MVALIKLLFWGFVLLFGLAMFGETKSHKVIESGSGGGIKVAESRCTVTASAYASLRTGDSYSAAVRKLGCRGEEISRSEMSGYVTVMYAWFGAGLGANMNAMFQNDELVSKSQFGL
jgi:hypothetical protein